MFDFDEGKRYALKTVDLNAQPAQAIEALKEEIAILRRLQFSDRVIKLIDQSVLPPPSPRCQRRTIVGGRFPLSLTTK